MSLSSRLASASRYLQMPVAYAFRAAEVELCNNNGNTGATYWVQTTGAREGLLLFGPTGQAQRATTTRLLRKSYVAFGCTAGLSKS